MSETTNCEWSVTMVASPGRAPAPPLTPERAEIKALKSTLREAYLCWAAALRSRALWRSRFKAAEVVIAKEHAENEGLRDELKKRDRTEQVQRIAAELAEMQSKLAAVEGSSKKVMQEQAEAIQKLSQENKKLLEEASRAQGAKFELHRILVGATGKTNKDVLNEIKRIRDLLGGEP